MTEVQTAIVVGGGIAGPVAALALRKAGIAATVYEAYPSTADGMRPCSSRARSTPMWANPLSPPPPSTRLN